LRTILYTYSVTPDEIILCKCMRRKKVIRRVYAHTETISPACTHYIIVIIIISSTHTHSPVSPGTIIIIRFFCIRLMNVLTGPARYSFVLFFFHILYIRQVFFFCLLLSSTIHTYIIIYCTHDEGIFLKNPRRDHNI